jgi:hypothetical protein
MDAFELLKRDHKKVSQLFKEIEPASGQAKLSLFKQLKSELDLHTHVEETIFYPALEKAKETRDITLEAYEEHKVVKDLLAELDNADSANAEWIAKLTVLKENVEHHVKEEEGEMFDKADDMLTSEQLESLGAEMEAEKKRRGGGTKAARISKTSEKPGLVRTIANALGIGASSAKPNRKPSKKSGESATKAIKTKPDVKQGSTVSAKKSTNASQLGRAGNATKTASSRSRATRKATSKSKATVKKANATMKKGKAAKNSAA